jgi:peptidoglycan/LPS O-acetylase OafA/YrhL
MTNLDWKALRAGGGVALVFAVPFAIAARLVASGDKRSGVAALLSLGALFGFILGAGVAAWVQQVKLPLKHGIICAVGSYLVAQTVFITIRLVSGNPVRWLNDLFILTVVGGAGLIGGGLGSSLQRRGLHPSSMRNSP